MNINQCLPNVQNALIEDRKIRNYLLDFSNPQNKGKALFFTSIGYSAENIEVFRSDLKAIAQNGIIKEVLPNIEGKKYIIVGSIIAPMAKAMFLKPFGLSSF